jgi:heptosyltransferase-2
MKLVVFAPNWLGDAVMALPAIADVRRGEPSASIDVAARASVAPLFSMVPGIADVIVVGDRGAAVAALRSRSYDAALLLPNSFNTALIARRAGIAARWGYRADFRGPLLTRAVSPPLRVHQAEYYQQLTRALGYASGPLEPRVVASDGAKASARALLTARGWNGVEPLVAIAAGAAFGSAKRWPAERFAALAARLGDDRVRCVLIGTRADADAAAEVLAHTGPTARVANLVGETDVPTLAGVLVQARRLITNDSGAMHLAAALGVPVTAMFGPTNERETYPLGPAAHTLLTHDVWCRPCMLRECPIDHRCMRGIGVERVLQSATA